MQCACSSYALGITGRLSGLVSSFTETEKELVAVERCTQYIDNIKPENFKGQHKHPDSYHSFFLFLEVFSNRSNFAFLHFDRPLISVCVSNRF